MKSQKNSSQQTRTFTLIQSALFFTSSNSFLLLPEIHWRCSNQKKLTQPQPHTLQIVYQQPITTDKLCLCPQKLLFHAGWQTLRESSVGLHIARELSKLDIDAEQQHIVPPLGTKVKSYPIYYSWHKLLLLWSSPQAHGRGQSATSFVQFCQHAPTPTDPSTGTDPLPTIISKSNRHWHTHRHTRTNCWHKQYIVGNCKGCQSTVGSHIGQRGGKNDRNEYKTHSDTWRLWREKCLIFIYYLFCGLLAEVQLSVMLWFDIFHLV